MPVILIPENETKRLNGQMIRDFVHSNVELVARQIKNMIVILLIMLLIRCI